jgi:hypothetical protein
LISEAKILQPETDWFWDLGSWDGKPYPGKSSFFVEIPVDVLDGAGGIFKQDEIKKIVQKHAAAGTYGIVKTYGRDPIITNVEPNAETILVEWQGITDTYYNVYYSVQDTGPWTLSNVSPIAYDSNGNSHLISNLMRGVKYYFYVAGGIMEDGEFISLVTHSVGPIDVGALDVERLCYRCSDLAPRVVSNGSLAMSVNLLLRGKMICQLQLYGQWRS